MIKAVVFDWGGVLIDDPSDDLFKYCAQTLGVEKNTLKLTMESHLENFQKGMITEMQLWRAVCDHLHVPILQQRSLWLDAVQHVFVDKKEMHDLARELRRKGYKIGFLSNTELPTTKYFFEKNYEQMFDEIVFSCVEHVVKPDPHIYKLIAQRLQVLVGEVIFIDDKLPYVHAAKNVGMQGVHFKNAQQVIDDVNVLIGV